MTRSCFALGATHGSGREIGACHSELEREESKRLRADTDGSVEHLYVRALAVSDSLTFNDLKALLKTSDGNLSVHARKLEEAQYVACTKSFAGRVPQTAYRLTAAGRRALERYLDHMEALIRATRVR